MEASKDPKKRGEKPSVTRTLILVCAIGALLLSIGMPIPVVTEKELVSIPEPTKLHPSAECKFLWSQFYITSEFQQPKKEWKENAQVLLESLLNTKCIKKSS